jgi:hypothetical protein
MEVVYDINHAKGLLQRKRKSAPFLTRGFAKRAFGWVRAPLQAATARGLRKVSCMLRCTEI